MSRQPQTTVNLQGKDYQKVAYRVTEFRRLCPISAGWGLVTSFEMHGEAVEWRAAIEDPNGKTVATGHSRGKVGRDKAFEKLESVAVGRALAAAGLTGEEYATADEMLVWQEGRDEELSPARKSTPAEWSVSMAAFFRDHDIDPAKVLSKLEGQGKSPRLSMDEEDALMSYLTANLQRFQVSP